MKVTIKQLLAKKANIRAERHRIERLYRYDGDLLWQWLVDKWMTENKKCEEQMDKQIRKIEKENKKEGKSLKKLEKMDKKNDKIVDKAKKKMKGKC